MMRWQKTEKVWIRIDWMQSHLVSLKMHELNVTWATRVEWAAIWAKWPELNMTWATKVAHELNELKDMSAGWGAFSWGGCSTASSWGEARWPRRPSRPTSTGTPPTRCSTRFLYIPIHHLVKFIQPSHLTDFEPDILFFPFCLSVTPPSSSSSSSCRRRWCLGWMRTTIPGSTIRSRLSRFECEWWLLL